MTDYVSTLNVDLSLIGPELALLAAAAIIMLFSAAKSLIKFAPYIALAGFAASIVLAVMQWGLATTGFAAMVTIDKFGVIFKLIFLVASTLSLFMAFRYLQVKGIHKPEFYSLLLVSTIGMMVMANTTDLIVLFLGLEIMSVPLYVMAAFNRRSLESNEAGIKYFIMGSFATGFLLMGIAFVYGAAESTSLVRIVTDFRYIAERAGLYLYAGAALLLIGFGFKVAAFPFHSWVPDVYQGAPTPVTAFFSVAPKAAGFAALLRIFLFGFADMAILSDIFSVIAVLTMTVGNILALRQDNVKRMLAYSSISHAGYILVALAAGGASSVSAAIFYLVAYTMFNLGAFAVVTVLETRTGMKADFSELAGLSRGNPFLAATLALFMFALSGFPPTAGFLGKFYLFSAAVERGFIILTVIGVLNSFVSVYYYLRVIKVSYFDTFEEKPIPVAVNFAVLIVLIVTALGTLGLGFFPDQILTFSREAIFAVL
ncbi:MAG: NADH-quinone oxidoreductase subunit N [candidate division Zixibacteria bacterium]|nr:NADH-quinone oxidoreductase subunit N [candidate division Zixibacteria bacterium]